MNPKNLNHIIYALTLLKTKDHKKCFTSLGNLEEYKYSPLINKKRDYFFNCRSC